MNNFMQNKRIGESIHKTHFKHKEAVPKSNMKKIAKIVDFGHRSQGWTNFIKIITSKI